MSFWTATKSNEPTVYTGKGQHSFLLNMTKLFKKTDKGMIKASFLTITEETQLGAGCKLPPSVHQSATNRST